MGTRAPCGGVGLRRPDLHMATGHHGPFHAVGAGRPPIRPGRAIRQGAGSPDSPRARQVTSCLRPASVVMVRPSRSDYRSVSGTQQPPWYGVVAMAEDARGRRRPNPGP